MKRLFIAWLTGRRRVKNIRNGLRSQVEQAAIFIKRAWNAEDELRNIRRELSKKDEEITKLKLILRSIAMDDSTNELIKAMEK